MKKKILAGLIGMVFLLGFTGMTSAAVIYTSTEVDLANGFSILEYPDCKYFRANKIFSLDNTFWAGKGDKIIVDVSFADNKALKIHSSNGSHQEYFYASISATVPGSHSTTSSGYTDFLGVQGSLLQNHIYIGNQTGLGNTVHSPSVGSYNTNLTDSWFSFTGMRLEIDIVSMLNGPSPYFETQGYFDRTGGLQFKGGDFEVVSAAVPTPVPGAIWLLGSGMIGLAGLGRKLPPGKAGQNA